MSVLLLAMLCEKWESVPLFALLWVMTWLKWEWVMMSVLLLGMLCAKLEWVQMSELLWVMT